MNIILIGQECKGGYETIAIALVELRGSQLSHHCTRRTPLDACGHVYKDLDEVLRVLEAEGIARVANRMYPLANIKGTD